MDPGLISGSTILRHTFGAILVLQKKKKLLEDIVILLHLVGAIKWGKYVGIQSRCIHGSYERMPRSGRTMLGAKNASTSNYPRAQRVQYGNPFWP